MRARPLVILLLAALAGCAESSGDPDTGPGAGDAHVPSMDAGTPPARDSSVRLPDTGPGPVDAGADSGTGGGDDGGTPPPSGPVRFVVMGDTGEGNEDQYAVADAIETTCAADGCDFVILLGDNIYDSGVDSTSDPQWASKFENPYADLDLPFYAVLGNHDYGGELFGDRGGLGNEFDKGPIEVAYTAVSSKWTMPDTHYTFRVGNVGFVMLDTNSILWDNTDNGNQRAWFPGAVSALRAEGAEWIISAGHHPVRSNGPHGNAGAYEALEIGGIDLPIPVPIMDGRNVEDFFEDVVCGNVDVYMAGHDHSRQWINEPSALCGAHLIVSGAGAKTTSIDNPERNETFFQDADTEGFMYVVIDGDSFYGRWVDRNGVTNYERMVSRPSM